jgi:hypothetical protein
LPSSIAAATASAEAIELAPDIVRYIAVSVQKKGGNNDDRNVRNRGQNKKSEGSTFSSEISRGAGLLINPGIKAENAGYILRLTRSIRLNIDLEISYIQASH